MVNRRVICPIAVSPGLCPGVKRQRRFGFTKRIATIVLQHAIAPGQSPGLTAASRLPVRAFIAMMPRMPEADSIGVRHVVGVMTGTSLDGVDAALARIDGRGLDMNVTLIAHVAKPLGRLAAPLRAAAEQDSMTAGEFAELARNMGLLHADVIAELPAAAAAIPALPKPDLICVHGQTVFHAPPLSWQLINPAPIAARFGCPVVFDLRQADLAAGGEGAPITPIADWILFRHPQRRRAVVNLGGFCNVTILPARQASANTASMRELDGIRGFDVCTCNQILDAAARESLGKPYDENGSVAASASPDPQAAASLLELLARQSAAGRSLGTADETLGWLDNHGRDLPPPVLLSSVAHAVGRCIAQALDGHEPDEVILAGGGAKNAALVRAIAEHGGFRSAISCGDLGVPAEAREALCFAVLGALCADGVAITLPRVTGCRTPAPVSGAWVNAPFI